MALEQRAAQLAEWISSNGLTGMEPNIILAVVTTFLMAQQSDAADEIDRLRAEVGAMSDLAQTRLKYLNAAMEACDRANARIAGLEAALQRPFLSLFIDGRNEHGAHLLSLPGDSIGDLKEILRGLETQDDGLAERIISEAEAMGFAIGMCVVTLWHREKCEPEMSDYWDYQCIDPLLTEVFYGSAEAQTHSAAKAALDGDKS